MLEAISLVWTWQIGNCKQNLKKMDFHGILLKDRMDSFLSVNMFLRKLLRILIIWNYYLKSMEILFNRIPLKICISKYQHLFLLSVNIWLCILGIWYSQVHLVEWDQLNLRINYMLNYYRIMKPLLKSNFKWIDDKW